MAAKTEKPGLLDRVLAIFGSRGQLPSALDARIASEMAKAEAELGKPSVKTWVPARILVAQQIFGEGLITPGGKAAIEHLLSPLSPGGGQVAADLGAGLGGVGFMLAKTYGVKVTGFEVNPALAQAANRLAKRDGIDKLAGVRAASSGLAGMKPGSLDYIVAKESFFLAPDKTSLFRQIGQALKPGGETVFTDYVAGGGSAEQLAGFVGAEPVAPKLVDGEAQIAALQAAGFEVLEAEDIGALHRAAIVRAFAKYGEMMSHGLIATKWKGWALAEGELWLRRIRAIDQGLIQVQRVHARKG